MAAGWTAESLLAHLGLELETQLAQATQLPETTAALAALEAALQAAIVRAGEERVAASEAWSGSVAELERVAEVAHEEASIEHALDRIEACRVTAKGRPATEEDAVTITTVTIHANPFATA